MTLVVVGDSLLDSDLQGTVERLCPDAPVPVVDVTGERLRPGGAGLAALLAVTAGRSVRLVTALGADEAAGRILRLLVAAGVDVARAPLRGATVRKTRVRVGGQSLLRLDCGDGRATDGPVGAEVLDAVRGAAAVLVADYGRGVAANPAIRRALGELAVPVVWDPHPKGPEPVAGCRLVTPNEKEALGFAAGCADAGSAAAVLAQRWGCAAVAVTLGARGALLHSAGRNRLVPAPPARGTRGPQGGTGVFGVADVCGAGDSFAVATACALLDGAPVERAVTTAVESATRFVAAGGAGVIGAAGGAGVIGAAGGAGAPRVQPAASALEFAAWLRERGGRLVATGGCFDLLHPGHIGLLRQARALGDGLVVCVNSDDSVRRLKGADRPIMPLAARVDVLAALEPVDAVAAFDEDTPAALLERLRPDVWVKGGDYAVDDLPEAGVVRRHGGEVVLVPFVDGYSTSRLVQQLATGGSR